MKRNCLFIILALLFLLFGCKTEQEITPDTTYPPEHGTEIEHTDDIEKTINKVLYNLDELNFTPPEGYISYNTFQWLDDNNLLIGCIRQNNNIDSEYQENKIYLYSVESKAAVEIYSDENSFTIDSFKVYSYQNNFCIYTTEVALFFENQVFKENFVSPDNSSRLIHMTVSPQLDYILFWDDNRGVILKNLLTKEEIVTFDFMKGNIYFVEDNGKKFLYQVKYIEGQSSFYIYDIAESKFNEYSSDIKFDYSLPLRINGGEVVMFIDLLDEGNKYIYSLDLANNKKELLFKEFDPFSGNGIYVNSDYAVYFSEIGNKSQSNPKWIVDGEIVKYDLEKNEHTIISELITGNISLLTASSTGNAVFYKLTVYGDNNEFAEERCLILQKP